MKFPEHAYLAAGTVAFLAALLSMPLWRWLCIRTGHVDDPGHRKIHDHPIALAGGLGALTGFLAPVVGGLLFVLAGGLPESVMDQLSYGFAARKWQLLAIVGGALGMVALGWWDDRHELRPSVKFAGQLLITLAVAASGVRITLFVPSVLFSYFITILWMLTLINALNFMDNMNGLCAGIGTIAAGWFAAIAIGHGQYLVALLALAIGCALLGFLPYNFPKASAFLGDAGSHLVGFLLAVLAILPHFYSETSPNRLAVISPLLILGVPLLDLAWVVSIRWRLGKPFWIGDNNHLSHRLNRAGLSRPNAVLVLWLGGLLFGAVAFALN
ncbi:MAG TPA: MraY family glycosyltransferase [Verrucomicrobiae bacterium]|nr:MraY family glycosyltransferase [Verrucomicrobiae bacterium]